MIRQASVIAQTRRSLRYSHTQIMDLDADSIYAVFNGEQEKESISRVRVG